MTGNTAQAIEVKAARLGGDADALRMVIEFSGTPAYKYFALANPHRLVLDLEGIDPGNETLRTLTTKIKTDDPFITSIRIAANRPGITRLVTDLKTAMKPLVSLLPAGSDIGPRLVVDLVPGAAPPAPPPAKPLAGVMPGAPAAPVVAPRAEEPAKTSGASTPTPQTATAVEPAVASAEAKTLPVSKMESVAATEKPANPPAEVKSTAHAKSTERNESRETVAAPQAGASTPESTGKAVSLERQVTQAISQARTVEDKNARQAHKKEKENGYKRLVTVAIDPGHGGADPGALGANGSQEKDITLAVARRLKTHIDKQEGMRAILTRDGDYFIALHERVNKARRMQADLFVSIHADAFLKSTARGSSVFALSEKGATSAAARWLAKRENEADLIGGINLDVKDVYLKQTLIDLSQTATIADSLKLGKAVLTELSEINELHKAKVEQAGFAVLKAPDIPSILVETAFISNPDEEKRLLDEDYQERMAEAIVTGIKSYFDNNPPLARAKIAQNL
jgi:N-acetylmuramoyl-L-alanine amidase